MPRSPAHPAPTGATIQPTLTTKAGAAPTGLTASAASAFAVSLSWNPVPDAVGYRISRNDLLITPTAIAGTYAAKALGVSRPTASAARGGQPATVETRCCAYTDPVLAGSRYRYNVQAVFADSTVAGTWSADAVVTTPHVAAPRVVTVVPGESSMRLSWEPVSGASGYLVIRDGTAITSRPVRGTSYVDTGLRPGTYTYRVASYEKILVGRKDTAEAEGDLSALTAVRGSTPIRGFADTHSHVFADLAFGGLLFWGQAYGTEQHALQACEPAHDFGLLPNLLGVLSGVHPSSTHGAPDYTGWPRWNTLLHQQMYETWLRRAYDGGLSRALGRSE
jgi:hypothetical protein